MTNDPIEYNELVELIENNDPGVVASTIQATRTYNGELIGLVNQWRDRVSHDADTTLDRSANIALKQCADELEELINE